MNTILPQPDIYLFGIRIQEPMTTFTDIILALACFYAYRKLHQKAQHESTVYFFRLYFLLMGIATLCGGIFGHGFQYIFGFTGKLPGWITSMFAVMLIERSAIGYTMNLVPARWHQFMLRFNILELVVVMFLTLYYMNFRFVEFHAVYGFLVVVFSCHLFCFVKTKDKGSRLMLFGILLLVVTMFVFNYPVFLHVWFNHADFSHVLMTIVSFMFLKAALVFGKPPEVISSKTN